MNTHGSTQGERMSTTCPTCAAYLQRRRRILLPYIGRWVARAHHDRRPARIVADLLNAHHARYCQENA